MAAWDVFKPELLNQKVCRLLLGVHRKASRIAVLGELGRYPVFVRAITHALKYEWHVENNTKKSSLVFKAYQEIKQMDDLENGWFSRMKQLKLQLDIPVFKNNCKSETVGKKIKSIVESHFSNLWKQEVNLAKIGNDGLDHNTLRMYRTLKSSFTIEPYIQQVLNRNQRAAITRIRTSAHTLGVEQGRYTKPATPLNERLCKYCCKDTDKESFINNVTDKESFIDDEFHFLITCKVFNTKRNCLFGKVSAFDKHFNNLTAQQKMATLLCPSNIKSALIREKVWI